MTTRLPFTQLAVRRAIRAARAEGCSAVEIRPDGSMIVKVGDGGQDRVAAPATAPTGYEDAET